MISILQRVSHARVTVDGQVVGEIAGGLVALTAVHADDTGEDVEWTAGKLASLRIFRQGEKNFDQDVKQIGGSILLVSNFTVAADARSGRRPSLSGAAPPEQGRVLFEQLVAATRALGIPVETGRFGADMLVDIQNNGPLTLVIDSRESRRVVQL